MRSQLIILSVIGTMQPALAETQKISSIYQIWDNFLASSVAYSRCGAGDTALKMKFAANLRVISIRAAMQAKEEHPDQPDAVLVKALEVPGKGVRTTITEVIDAKGCESDAVKKLLKLYDFNANWVIGVKTGEQKSP